MEIQKRGYISIRKFLFSLTHPGPKSGNTSLILGKVGNLAERIDSASVKSGESLPLLLPGANAFNSSRGRLSAYGVTKAVATPMATTQKGWRNFHIEDSNCLFSTRQPKSRSRQATHTLFPTFRHPGNSRANTSPAVKRQKE